MSSRLLIVAPLAVIITGALFFLMRDLIDARAEKPEIVEAPVVELGRKIIEDPPPDNQLLKPVETTPPEAPPPERNIDMPRSGGEIGGSRVTLLPLDKNHFNPYADGDARDIIRPIDYPACGKGTGEAVIDFVVEPDGSLSDIRVVRATSSCFGKAAEHDARRWRYRPKMVDGQAVRSGRRQVTVQYVQEG